VNGLAGVAVTLEMVFSLVLQERAWPYWRITFLACVLSGLGVYFCLYLTGGSMPSKNLVIWILLTCFFGCLYWCASIMAVQVGTNPGDVASLTSLNIVVAAILGRLLLKEDFSYHHSMAILLALGGAILITQPPFIFGGEQSGFLGYGVAISAGFLQGCFFISSRMAADVSGWFMTGSIMLMTAPFALLVPYVPGFTDGKLDVIAAEPALAVLFVVGAIVTSIFSASTVCIGSCSCSAAVSATVYTSSSMLAGYAASVVMSKKPPTIVSLAGATLMLLAVVSVAFAGQKAADTAPAPMDDNASEASGSRSIRFGSFVAIEFSEFSASSPRSIRFRRPAAIREPGTVIGNALPVMATGPSGASA